MVKRFQLRPIFLALITLVMPAMASCTNHVTADVEAGPKAAIIDQLYSVKPNVLYIETTREILEAHGYAVDVWQGNDITVSFYKDLPARGYKLIIFRTHLGVLSLVSDSEVIPMKTTCLFTNEVYTTGKYVLEQFSERLQEGQMSEDYPTVFTLTPKFITDSMKGEFDDTAILMMGCASSYWDDMAAAFVEKGVSVYLGWNATVTLDYLDDTVLTLVDKLFAKQMNIEQAIASTMDEAGYDPYYNARLRYYPRSAGSQTISALEPRTSTSNKSALETAIH